MQKNDDNYINPFDDPAMLHVFLTRDLTLKNDNSPASRELRRGALIMMVFFVLIPGLFLFFMSL